MANEKEDDTYVQVYAPTQKEVLPEPNDPFFGYKKVGKVFMTDKAKSPKSAPMLATQTGLYMPGKGFSVSVNASMKVCSKAEVEEARRLDQIAGAVDETLARRAPSSRARRPSAARSR